MSDESADSAVNHPKHYNSHPSGIECIVVARHHTFNIGNVFKYLWRAGLKGSSPKLQDLEKAAFYLADEIAWLRLSEAEQQSKMEAAKVSVSELDLEHG